MVEARRRVRIANHGQIPVPADLLRKHQLRDGDEVEVEDTDRGLLIVPQVGTDSKTRERAPEPLIIPEPTAEQLAQRQALGARVLANRKRRQISPLTTADLVHMAREDETWYGSGH